jgi:hypothetical protein
LAKSVQITAVADPALPEDSQDNGLWVSMRGDWTKRSSQTQFNFLNAPNVASPGYTQHAFGLDGGVDFVVDHAGGGTAMFGLMAGYQNANLNFNGSGNGITIEGGSLGAYAGYADQGFFADALLKHDWMALDYSVAGLGNADTKARSWGLSGDVGYRFGVKRGYVEPLVSLEAMSTRIADFDLGNATVSPGSNSLVRVGAGARFGMSGEAYDLSLTARVWEGIHGDNSVNLASAGFGVDIANQGLADGISGEISSRVAFNLNASSHLFAEGAVQFGKDVASQSVQGGLQFKF